MADIRRPAAPAPPPRPAPPPPIGRRLFLAGTAGAAAPVVATELVGTSISSCASKTGGFRRHLADNPHVRFFESRLRGYTRCTVIRERRHADLRVVDTVERPGAPVRTLASWVVENRRPGAEQV
jgi:alkaline phosphatase D